MSIYVNVPILFFLQECTIIHLCCFLGVFLIENHFHTLSIVLPLAVILM